MGRYPSGQQATTSAAREFLFFLRFTAATLPSPFRFKADDGHAGTGQPAVAESARLDRFAPFENRVDFSFESKAVKLRTSRFLSVAHEADRPCKGNHFA